MLKNHLFYVKFLQYENLKDNIRRYYVGRVNYVTSYISFRW